MHVYSSQRFCGLRDALNSQFNHMSVSYLKDEKERGSMPLEGAESLFSAVVHASSYANKGLKGSRVWLEGLHCTQGANWHSRQDGWTPVHFFFVLPA